MANEIEQSDDEVAGELRQLNAVVPEDLAGQRLDQALSRMFSDYSRSRLQQWLKAGHVSVDGHQMRARDKVYGGEQVIVEVQQEEAGEWVAEDIPLEIVYEDEHILVINKPAGMVVHPAAGNYQGTLLNALLHHDSTLNQVPRAGIVHRLDKDTTGLLVVARTLPAQKHLVEQLQARAFLREYQTIVTGVMTAGGTVDEPIGRHAVHRKRMAVMPFGKEAITHYRVVEKYRAHTLVRVRLETGRTHQIRVHMSYLHYPVLGDPVYGGRLRLPADCNEEMKSVLRNFKRQALHAGHLGLLHPYSGEQLEWTCAVPHDMAQVMDVLHKDLLEHDSDDIDSGF